MTTPLMLIGEGSLAEALRRSLGRDSRYTVSMYSRIPTDLLQSPDAPVALALVVADSWNPADHQMAEAVFRQAGIPWLRGFVVFDEGIIGPVVMPDGKGCSQCADARRIMTMSDRNEMFELKAQLTARSGVHHNPALSAIAAAHMAQLMTAELENVYHRHQPWSLEESILSIKLRTLATSRHRFLPHPSCPVCGELPTDSAELAVLQLPSMPKANSDTYRTKTLGELQQVLEPTYLDGRSGLLNAKVHDLIAPYAAVSVNLPLLLGDEGASGRAQTYPEAELTAILEGLERYCGVQPRGRTNFTFDSYANLRANAIDPRSVGLHDARRYDEPNFPFHKFSDDVPLEWVWGYSLTKHEPVLVPKLLAYYSLGDGQGFVYETSNGCAIGGSLVEAIFHGILEVVERDAFLMTWYAKLPLRRVNVASIDNEEIQLMVQKLRDVTGYEIHLYDATMENGIPTAFAIAKNLRGEGVNLICAAGSHVDGVRAVAGAIHEAAGMLLRFDGKLRHHRTELLEMYHDSSFVQQMEDHSMLYSLPEAEERLSFLLSRDGPGMDFEDAFHWPERRGDLREDLYDLIGVFGHLGMDVIVVNQTSSELAQRDLHCVKVLIPGMLPMTFGHHLKRLAGLERVLRVPMELGYVTKPLTPEQLNPFPHPFP